ncbi:MAG: hypothetical protein S0880_06110 [Actinomycetota bacterium]|nr:hypothetical protein [Actinomycetota bacterium]
MMVEHGRGALDDAMRSGDEAVDVGVDLFDTLSAEDPRFDAVVSELAVAFAGLSRVASDAGDDDRRAGLLRRADDVSARGDGPGATRARTAVAHEMTVHMLDDVVARARSRRAAPETDDVARVLVNTSAIVDLRRDLAVRSDPATYLDLAESLFVHGRALALGRNGQMAVDALAESISLLDQFDGDAVDAERARAVDELELVGRTFPDVELPDLD